MKHTAADVVIIGAGPAGAVAAALLREAGRSVLVLERQHFPRFSIGESLLPQSMAYLEEAGMLQAVVEAGFQYKNGAQFVYRDRSSSFDFRDKHSAGWGTTYQVERAAFDDILIRCAARAGRRRALRPHGAGGSYGQRCAARVDVTDEAGHAYQIEARFMFDASGFGRVLPRLLNLEAPTRIPSARGAVLACVRRSCRPARTDRNKIMRGHAPRAPRRVVLDDSARGRTVVGGLRRGVEFSRCAGKRTRAMLRALIQKRADVRPADRRCAVPDAGASHRRLLGECRALASASAMRCSATRASFSIRCFHPA